MQLFFKELFLRSDYVRIRLRYDFVGRDWLCRAGIFLPVRIVLPAGSENGCDRKRPVCDRNGEATLGFADISYQRGVKDRQGEGRLRCCG